MHRRAGSRLRLARAGLAGLALLAACTNADASSPPGGSVEASPAPASVAPASSSASPGGAGATPGTPYAAADVLAAMRDSRRPGGVPDELETGDVAGAVAAGLWTWDGEPWETWSVGGACGPQTCSLDVAGTPASGAGTDLYSFVVARSSGEVTRAEVDLHGHPPALEAELDVVVRRALDVEDLEGLRLVGARWLPPPDTDRYWLAYRSGGEEGAPRLDVLVDLATGEVLRVERDT
jgi:hypothetical protein